MTATARWILLVLIVALVSGAIAWTLRGQIAPGAPDRAAPLAMTGDAEDAEPGAHAGHGGEPMVAADEAAPRKDAAEEPRIAIDVPPVQQARIGLRVAPIERAPVKTTIHTIGTFAVDERREAHVHTRIPGYIERIYVDAIGDPVKRGQILYRLYSPEVVATESEYVASAGRGGLSAMVPKAALERLALWEVPQGEIERLKRTREVSRAIPFTSPVRGVVLDKNVLRGMYVMPTMELYHIADLSKLWVIVTLYEHELAVVDVGDPVEITALGAPERPIRGTIDFLYPDVELATRTARARVEVENPEGALRPGMYAFVTIDKELGEAIVVPDDAVIDTGVRKLVFVHSGETRFTPREVELGPRVGRGYVVRRGLDPGDQVVVRASFLIDAESRLQAALARTGAPQGHGGHH